MAVELKDRKRASSGLKSWLDDVAAYEREFKPWEQRSEKILKRYRDEKRDSGGSAAKFNVLWSNTQTLTAATFARVPKPDVSRRFRDNDPVGRVASMILERALDFHIQHYTDYRSALKNCVLDRFLGGRGTIWVRYEPHFKDSSMPDGVEISEDVEGQDELDYECTAVDYVHWKDYGHSVARTWEEVNRVWRIVYMTKAACETRFGKEKAKLIPMDASPHEVKSTTDYKPGDSIQRAKIYEGWDKEEGSAVWFSKGVKDFLDDREDPLWLEEFFPCPRPIYATITNESLIPVPDFTLYQDQANELDTLCDRIDGLIKALQVKGVYDAAQGISIARIFTEGQNNTLLPVKNWAAFAEKNGLKGAIDLLDILPIAQALEQAYKAFDQVIKQIYQITGIADIVRGDTDPNETLGAQELKGQYASLRLKVYQEEVARFATGTLQIMAQVMCKKFQPQTLVQISAADQLSETDRQFIGPALQLLLGERMMNPDAQEGPNPLRDFRVEIAADTLVYLDEEAEKKSAMEFLAASGGFIQQMGAVLVQTPPEAKGPVVGLLMEMLKFGVTRFRVGKGLEGAFDETAEQLKKLASQPPPPPQPDPKLLAAQATAQSHVARAESEKQIAPVRAQAEMARAQADIIDSHAQVVVAANKVRESHIKASMPPSPGGMQ